MPVFQKDPCGFFCIFMTYGAVLYADYVVVRWIVLQTMSTTLWGSLHVLLFNIIIFMLFMSHARAVFSDPGIVPLPKHRIDFSDSHSEGGSIAPKEDWTICTRYVGLLSAYAIALVAWSWYTECTECPKDIRLKQSRILHSILLIMESVLFGMFVIAIACDQFEAIFTDETLVEQAKKQGPFRPRKPRLALLAEVCGRGHPILWFFPCHSGDKFAVEPLTNYNF